VVSHYTSPSREHSRELARLHSVCLVTTDATDAKDDIRRSQRYIPIIDEPENPVQRIVGAGLALPSQLLKNTSKFSTPSLDSVVWYRVYTSSEGATQMETLSIGQVARRAGVGVETVRFYEREGLLEEPPGLWLSSIL
jgi:hypothetical protein